MLTYETGDIVLGNYPVICHQVNCKGVMGAGLARQIKNEYPEVYMCYLRRCRLRNILGNIQPVVCHDGRVCVNMFAQDGYGRDRVYTDYYAFKMCLDHLVSYVNALQLVDFRKVVAFPYGIGCGLAGGDWKIIEKMIEEFSKQVSIDVIIVKKE